MSLWNVRHVLTAQSTVQSSQESAQVRIRKRYGGSKLDCVDSASKGEQGKSYPWRKLRNRINLLMLHLPQSVTCTRFGAYPPVR